MKLVADYGNECVTAGIASMNSRDDGRKRMEADVRKSHDALTARLRAILTELDAAREDAARWQEVAFGDSLDLGVFYVDNFGDEFVFEGQEAVDVVDAARKGGS